MFMNDLGHQGKSVRERLWVCDLKEDKPEFMRKK